MSDKEKPIEDPRDMEEPSFGKSDGVVIERMKEFAEELLEHFDSPTLGAYKCALDNELAWVRGEISLRQKLRSETAQPMPHSHLR